MLIYFQQDDPEIFFFLKASFSLITCTFLQVSKLNNIVLSSILFYFLRAFPPIIRQFLTSFRQYYSEKW